MYIVWALFVVGVAWTLVHLILKAKRHERRIADWPRTRATVTGSRTGWSGGMGNSSRSLRHYPYYQFTDPRGAVFSGESEESLRNGPLPGSSVDVAYDPADPATSFEVPSSNMLGLGCATVAFAVILSLMFWFIGVFPLL